MSCGRARCRPSLRSCPTTDPECARAAESWQSTSCSSLCVWRVHPRVGSNETYDRVVGDWWSISYVTSVMSRRHGLATLARTMHLSGPHPSRSRQQAEREHHDRRVMEIEEPLDIADFPLVSMCDRLFSGKVLWWPDDQSGRPWSGWGRGVKTRSEAVPIMTSRPPETFAGHVTVTACPPPPTASASTNLPPLWILWYNYNIPISVVSFLGPVSDLSPVRIQHVDKETP